MSDTITLIFDCVAAHHALEGLGRESVRRIEATFQAMGDAKPSAYDVYLRASQFPYHEEMVSAVRTAIRQPQGDSRGLAMEPITECWGWLAAAPTISPEQDAVLDLHLQGDQGKLPRTVGETIKAYPGAMFLRGWFLATIPLQARLLMTYRHLMTGRNWPEAPRPTTRVLIAADLLTVEFAGTQLDAELLRSGDVIRFTAELPDQPSPAWASIQSSEILRSPTTA